MNIETDPSLYLVACDVIDCRSSQIESLAVQLRGHDPPTTAHRCFEFVRDEIKHSGDYPLVGVNTFLSSNGSPTVLPREVIRATEHEKEKQIETVQFVWKRYEGVSTEALRNVQRAAIQNENVFEQLMEACKSCSLGQITDALFDVGGQYRRNM